MRRYDVVFGEAAISDLIRIAAYIADASGLPAVAHRYVDCVEAACRALESAPQRGRRRDDLRSGLRVLSVGNRTVAAFTVDEEADRVRILRIFHGGQHYESVLA